jgi:hypothetical protein
METKLCWHCNDCGILTRCENECRVEEEQYVEGDVEPCVYCAEGDAHVEVMPSDYEECGECGFDHAYAPDEASLAHATLSRAE